ncbi:MAG: peptidase domain-containing ABC transporter [Gammaproteobacteria bacterium]
MKSKLPIILQTEITECGHACLAMILKYYNLPIDLSALRRLFPTSLKGITLGSIVQIAEHFQLETRALRLEPDDLLSLPTPSILHWDMDHFVVLREYNHRKKHFILHNPACGEEKLTQQELSKHFTGIALEIEYHCAIDKKKQFKQGKLKCKDLIKNTPTIKYMAVKAILMAIMLQLFILIGPRFLQLSIDKVVSPNQINLLYVLTLGFAFLKILETGTAFIRSILLASLNNIINLNIGSHVFKHLIRLPMEYFSKRHLGDIVSRFNSVEIFRQVITDGLVEGGIDGLMAIATLILMLNYNVKLTIIVCSAIFIYCLLRISKTKSFITSNEIMIRNQARYNSNLFETIRGIQAIKIFSKENCRQSIWKNQYIDFLNSSFNVAKKQAIFSNSKRIIFGLELILVIMLATILVIEKQISIGMFYTFLFYRTIFNDAASKLIDKFGDFNMLSLHLDRLSDILLKEPEKIASQNKQTLNNTITNGSMELKNIYFRYNENENHVIKNASLKIEDGEFIAIAGPSGCGKTTLLKIMMGLQKPNHGDIIISGMNLKDINLANYRKQIASVMQEDSLFIGSIAENISFFDPNPIQDKIILCAKRAGILGDIMHMPMQFNSLIGDMGSALSGGQKQRLLLARALYAEPKILFLDEATSHLDLNKEKEINQAILQLKITRIIIAHRPETLATADRIIDFSSINQ